MELAESDSWDMARYVTIRGLLSGVVMWNNDCGRHYRRPGLE